MSPDSDLGFWLLLWICVSTIIVVAHWRKEIRGVGLVLGYVFNLSLIHFAGAAIYLSNLPHLYEIEEVEAGFREASWGLLSFGLGAIVIGPALLSVRRDASGDVHFEPAETIPKAYLIVGAVSYAALATFLTDIPTLNAAVGVGQYVFIVGICILVWKAWREGGRKKLIGLFFLALLLPFVTMIFQGFLGYGVAALAVVLFFFGSIMRPRWPLVIAALLIGYVGLSFFVTYIQNRESIREVVWAGRELPERVERVWLSTSEMERFDPGNAGHLDQIDRRLNQNHLVGAAVEHLESTQDYGKGDSLVQSVLALVPRFLWPEKDIEAGSPDLVSQYTGLQFAEGTSVGVGHVLEFYINFGTVGIIAGMLLLGVAVSILDLLAAQRLLQDDWAGFALRFLIGITLLQVGGSLVELTTGAGAAAVLAVGTNSYLYRLQKRKAIASQATEPTPDERLGETLASS